MTTYTSLEAAERERLMAKHQLTRAARGVILEIADFENMTDDAAKALRGLREAIRRLDAAYLTRSRLLNPR